VQKHSHDHADHGQNIDNDGGDSDDRTHPHSLPRRPITPQGDDKPTAGRETAPRGPALA
jgi:hypothetical protein